MARSLGRNERFRARTSEAMNLQFNARFITGRLRFGIVDERFNLDEAARSLLAASAS